jgi:hypothetical protein
MPAGLSSSAVPGRPGKPLRALPRGTSPGPEGGNGAIHVVVWLQDRRAWANLAFSITALAVAGMAAFEMGLMHTDSVERFGVLMRWIQVPLFVLVAGVVGFVGLYFGTGRWWLGCAAVGVRLVSLILNFIAEPNLSSSAPHQC